MKGVLLRVGCDSTTGGGNWNAPVNLQSLEYVYVPIWGVKTNIDISAIARHMALFPPHSSALGFLYRRTLPLIRRFILTLTSAL